MKSQWPYAVICLFSASLLVAGCGGGGGGGSKGGNNNSSDTTNDGPSNDGPSNDGPSNDGSSNDGSSSNDDTTAAVNTAIAESLSFNMSGAVALLASEDVIEEADDANKFVAKGGKTLFTYQVVGAQGVASKDSLSRRDEEVGGVSNLLAVDEDGNASLAIDTEYPVKVSYSIVSPDGSKVYLALDNGWHHHDGNDYSTFIASQDCSLFSVNLEDSSFECVAEGLYVQNMDENYRKAISGDQKPIQFDDEGNLYFSATTFTSNGDAWCNDPHNGFDDHGGDFDDHGGDFEVNFFMVNHACMTEGHRHGHMCFCEEDECNSANSKKAFQVLPLVFLLLGALMYLS